MHTVDVKSRCVSAAGDRGCIFNETHGQIDFGVGVINNQPAGHLNFETVYNDKTQFTSQIALNHTGEVSAYLGLHTSW